MIFGFSNKYSIFLGRSLTTAVMITTPVPRLAFSVSATSLDYDLYHKMALMTVRQSAESLQLSMP
jgi:hypothetical protein